MIYMKENLFKNETNQKKELLKNFNYDYISDSFSNDNNKNINLVKNPKIINNNAYNMHKKGLHVQDIRRKASNKEIKLYNKIKSNKRLNQFNNRNKEKKEKEKSSEEEENKDLIAILNNDGKNYINKSIKEDKKMEDDTDEKNKLQKEIDRGLLYLVLFLKQKNIQINNKEVLYKLQKNKNFKKGIEFLKSKINKNKEHAKTLGIISSSNKAKNITDEHIINYLYNIFMDTHSPYHVIFDNKEDFIQNVNWKNISYFKNYNNIFLLLENEEKKERQRKLKQLDAYNKKVMLELKNE